jgi:hypothetical protein
MSLTLIAMTGILVGFLCLVIGFFMEDSKGDASGANVVGERRSKPTKKKMVVHKRKAA